MQPYLEAYRMNSEALLESLLCTNCGHFVSTGKTVGLPDAKRIRCPSCQEVFELGDGRRAAKSQIVEPLPIQTVSTPSLPDQSKPRSSHAQSIVSRSLATSLPASQPSELTRYMAEGQNPEVIGRLLQQVKDICTSTEEVLYMAVQERPLVNIKPDAVVLTSRRFIIFRPKLLGRIEFQDCLWLHTNDIHMKEDMIGATILFTGMNGHVDKVEYLPRAQARMIYRIAQQKEEEMLELRRERMMEEQRNAANQVNVNTQVVPHVPQASSDDPVIKLQQIKQMLSANLISQDEYDAKKQQILDAM